MGFFDLTVLVLCVNQIIETFRHGSIFAETRAKYEAGDRFIDELISCPFCLSHWVAAGTVLWYVIAFLLFESWLRILVSVPIYTFAVSRGAQLVNDVLAPFSRTPSQSQFAEDDRPEPDHAETEL
jgi:hypothetical protein